MCLRAYAHDNRYSLPREYLLFLRARYWGPFRFPSCCPDQGKIWKFTEQSAGRVSSTMDSFPKPFRGFRYSYQVLRAAFQSDSRWISRANQCPKHWS